MLTEQQSQFIVATTNAAATNNTISAYIHDLCAFNAWCATVATDNAVQTIASATAIAYRTTLVASGKAPATINRHLATLRAWGKYAVITGIVNANPFGALPNAEQQPLAPSGMERSEIARLQRALERAIETANTPINRDIAIRNRAAIMTMLQTGLRIGELVALQTNDIAITSRRGLITVRHGKGGKTRTVPLDAIARAAINEWLAARAPYATESEKNVFIGLRHRGGVSADSIRKAFKAACDMANIENATPHTLRHTRAHTLIHAGADMPTVAAILGHANLNTTMRYTMPSVAHMEKWVEKSI